MRLLEARGLRKEYQANGLRVEVLRGIDLTIDAGEFVALIGPSGSGKSSLLYVLGLMEKPSSGTLLYGNRDVAGMDASEMADIRRRELGFVFQAYNLLPALSVLANVELPLRLCGVSTRTRRTRAHQLLMDLGLAEKLRYHPNRLSGGERQRVALARALANGPTLVLADEPTGNLDSEATHAVMAILSQANREGTTVLVVTHNPEVAVYASRVLRMRDGKVRLMVRETVDSERRPPAGGIESKDEGRSES